MKIGKSKMLVAACGLSLALAGGAHAGTVVFSDDFSGDGVGANLTSLSNWDVTSGNIDVIGPGFWDLLPGNNNYVDMDGMALGTLSLRDGIDLEAGTYELSFDLAGNRRVNQADSVEVTLGSIYSDVFALAPSAGFQTFTTEFTLDSAANLSLLFAAGGVVDHVGMLLDNVLITMIDGGNPVQGDGPPNVSTVPTPAAAMAGLALMGVLGLRRKRQA